jgi:hypothetical protein
MSVCSRQHAIAHAYPCLDAWRNPAVIVLDKYLVPHRNRFAHNLGDSRVKPFVLFGMQVVDVRGELDIEALSLEPDFSW